VKEARFIELANRIDAPQLKFRVAMAMAFSTARHGMPCDSLMAFVRCRKRGRIFSNEGRGVCVMPLGSI